MIRCRRCGITYKDDATLCLRCMNPLPKTAKKQTDRKPVRKEVLDRLIAEKSTKNVLIATATPRPRKFGPKSQIETSSSESVVFRESSGISVTNNTVLRRVVTKEEVSKTSETVAIEHPIQNILPAKEIVPDTNTSKNEISLAKEPSVSVTEKETFKQDVSKLAEAIKGLEPDKTIEGIDPRLGDIRVDEVEKLVSIINNLENANEIYARSQERILFDRGYVLQSGFITHLNIFDLGITILPNNLASLQKLSSLDLERNNFENFPDGLDKLTSLKNLNVSENKLKEQSSSVGRLTNLTSLWLYDNEITKIPQSLGTLTNLELLDLRGNKLTTDDLDPIWQLRNLKYLSLESNNLKSLPEYLDTLTDLEVLLVGHNPLESFPDISNLRKLKELSLYGTKLKYAPESILFLPNLHTLDLWNTGINPDDWVLMELKEAGVIIKIDSH